MTAIWLLYEERDKDSFLAGKQVPAFADCPHCGSEAWFSLTLFQVDTDGQVNATCDRCNKGFVGRLDVTQKMLGV